MEQHQVKELLRKAIGLEITSVGQSRIDRAVEQRMSALDLTNVEEYAIRLSENEDEVASLVEEVVVPETWFFRDKEPFSVLAQYVVNEWDRRNHGRILKLLSVPCSTGEEPYSMAMALLDAGWPEERFSIDAVDISSRVLKCARQACYKDYAFREKGVSSVSRYFTKTEEGYLLAESVRSKVRFVQDNVLAPCFLVGVNRYDIIFCRNLLIYLDKFSANQVVNTMEQLLVSDGVLFVGHAETGRIPTEKFVATPYPKSFSFIKRNIPQTICTCNFFDRKLSNAPSLDKAPCETVIKSSTLNKKTHRKAGRHTRTTQIKKEGSLEEARRLADQGDLEKAACMCEEYLRDHGPSPTAYFLLGVVCEASGDSDRAFKALQKTVYLQPDHYEALFLLALMSERAGDQARAESFKKRAMRAMGAKAEDKVPT